MAVPTGWDDANGVLTAPNKKTVTLGFADWIRKHEWEAADMPLELEHGKLDGSAGTEQVFVESGLVWDSAGGVRRMDLGARYLALLAKVSGMTAVDPTKIAAVVADMQALATALAALQAAQPVAAPAPAPATPAPASTPASGAAGGGPADGVANDEAGA